MRPAVVGVAAALLLYDVLGETGDAAVVPSKESDASGAAAAVVSSEVGLCRTPAITQTRSADIARCSCI